jgi:hypothetical protein
MIQRISQSFIKDFSSYLEGEECGLIINAKYVDDRILDDPDADPGAKELGAYFEFLAFGALPKSGIVPKAKMMASGKDMMAEYRLATINAKRVRELITVTWKLEIVKVGWHVTKGRFSGTIDMLCKATDFVTFDNGESWEPGQYIVIDLKYSGLVGDTTPSYNKHGWKFSPVQRRYHGIQAKQYYFITDETPFYFLVTQSNNKEGTVSDMKFFHVKIDQTDVARHINEANEYFEKFEVMAQVGFTPRPSLKRCSKCPLREECTVKHVYPHPETILLNEDL